MSSEPSFHGSPEPMAFIYGLVLGSVISTLESRIAETHTINLQNGNEDLRGRKPRDAILIRGAL